MKTSNEYGNKPQGYSDLDDEIAEDVKFKDDNENAKAAFLLDQRHDEGPGNATSDRDQADPIVEVVVITDVIDRRTGIFNNRRTGALNDRRTGALNDRRTDFYDRRNRTSIDRRIDDSFVDADRLAHPG